MVTFKAIVVPRRLIPVGKIASFDRGWLPDDAVAGRGHWRRVGKIASFDRGWLPRLLEVHPYYDTAWEK